MFKRLLARLFGRKPASETTSIKVVPPHLAAITGYQPRAAATPARPPQKPSQGTGMNLNARVVGMNVRQERRDDISDPLHPLNPGHPVYVDTTSIGDACAGHRSHTISHLQSHSSHHSSSHDSGSYDSGSYDSGSSSSSCD